MEKRMSFFVLFLAFLLPYLAATLALVLPTVSQAAVGLDGSVEVSEENFPDERFRALAVYLDVNRDNVLSLEERSVLKSLTVEYEGVRKELPEQPYSWVCLNRPVREKGRVNYEYANPSDMLLKWNGNERSKNLCVKGIEFFSELRVYRVYGYMHTEGSLRGNSRLWEVFLSDSGSESQAESEKLYEMEDCSRIENDFPVEQLTSMRIAGWFRFKKFSLPHAVDLETLELGGAGGTDYAYMQIETLDLSANKNLQDLTMNDVLVGKREWVESILAPRVIVGDVDLRGNRKLVSVSIGGVFVRYDFLTEEKQYIDPYTFQTPPYKEPYARVGMPYTMTGEKYHLKLPKNNRIQKLTYVTKDDSLDLSECRKLRYLRVQAGMKLKLNRRWYQSFGRKNLMLVVRGTKTAKKVSSKTKKYLYIRASKLRGQMPEDID